jgi:hypothetical protein
VYYRRSYPQGGSFPAKADFSRKTVNAALSGA